MAEQKCNLCLGKGVLEYQTFTHGAVEMVVCESCKGSGEMVIPDAPRGGMAEQRCKVCGLEIAWCEWRDWEDNPQGAWMHVPQAYHEARPSSTPDAECSICGHPQHDMMCNRSLWCGSCNCPGEKQAAAWAAAIQPNAEAARERDRLREAEVSHE